MKNTMTYRSYTASLELDEDDPILVGRVLEVDESSYSMAYRSPSSRKHSMKPLMATSLRVKNWGRRPKNPLREN